MLGCANVSPARLDSSSPGTDFKTNKICASEVFDENPETDESYYVDACWNDVLNEKSDPEDAYESHVVLSIAVDNSIIPDAMENSMGMKCKVVKFDGTYFSLINLNMLDAVQMNEKIVAISNSRLLSGDVLLHAKKFHTGICIQSNKDFVSLFDDYLHSHGNLKQCKSSLLHNAASTLKDGVTPLNGKEDLWRLVFTRRIATVDSQGKIMDMLLNAENINLNDVLASKVMSLVVVVLPLRGTTEALNGLWFCCYLGLVNLTMSGMVYRNPWDIGMVCYFNFRSSLDGLVPDLCHNLLGIQVADCGLKKHWILYFLHSLGTNDVYFKDDSKSSHELSTKISELSKKTTPLLMRGDDFMGFVCNSTLADSEFNEAAKQHMHCSYNIHDILHKSDLEVGNVAMDRDAFGHPWDPGISYQGKTISTIVCYILDNNIVRLLGLSTYLGTSMLVGEGISWSLRTRVLRERECHDALTIGPTRTKNVMVKPYGKQNQQKE
ncbi:hypothetical protein LIER_41063 [Lithospermum erythrorhizon]|uniref:Uncharacterized protein n=1 Tax=Lithospermum erythrorhizon TaxID=34254 RepID=A0AAV3R6V5_LITER